MIDFTFKTKVVDIVKSVTGHYDYFYFILFPLVTKLQTFIKDTSDVIRLCKNFKFTDDYQYRYLFTMDISSLCTNIPTAEGLSALKYYLEYYPDENRPSTPTLLKLTELVLNISSFEFDGKYYIQKKCVAMGTKMVPSNACQFLATLRRRCFSRTLVPNLLCYEDILMTILASVRQQRMNSKILCNMSMTFIRH